MPKFFAPEKPKVQIRDRALVYWDFDSVKLSDWHSDASKWDDFIEDEVYKRIPKPTHEQFKVFAGVSIHQVLSQLQDLNWDIRDGDSDIVHHALSESGQDTDASVVFLISADPSHIELIEWLREDGVLVYLMAPSGVEESMIRAVGKKRWINLDGLPGLVNFLESKPPFDYLS